MTRQQTLQYLWRDVKGFGLHVETGLLALTVLELFCPEWEDAEAAEAKCLYVAALRLAMKYLDVHEYSVHEMKWGDTDAHDIASTEWDMLRTLEYRMGHETIATYLGEELDPNKDLVIEATYDRDVMKHHPERIADAIKRCETIEQVKLAL
jgi:hypothetical protein